MRRLLITGSRDWDRPELIAEQFKIYGRAWVSVTLVVGDCPTGADFYAKIEACALGWEIEEYEADWWLSGKAAGPIRNLAMVNSGADECYAYLKHSSKNIGTQGCMKIARKAGIPVLPIWG